MSAKAKNTRPGTPLVHLFQGTKWSLVAGLFSHVRTGVLENIPSTYSVVVGSSGEKPYKARQRVNPDNCYGDELLIGLMMGQPT